MTAHRFSLALATGLLFVTATAAEEVRGRIIRIDPDKKEIRLATLRPQRGGILDVKIDAKTEILIGGQPATLKDLAPNRLVRIVFQRRDGQAVAQGIRAFGLLALTAPPQGRGGERGQPAAPPAAPLKDGEGVAGTLQRISAVESEIVVVGNGPKGANTETTVAVADKTAILRDGKKIALDDLKEGETVTVKTESHKGKLTAVSIQTGQMATTTPTAQPAGSQRRDLVPRLRQALKMADELLREMEERNGPPPERP